MAVRKQRTITEHQYLTQPNSRDARSSVRSRLCSNNPCNLLADARTSVPTGLWDDWCEAGTRRGHYSGYSLLADARTSVPTVRMCEELMLCDCSLVYGHRDGPLLTHVNNRYLS